MSWYLLLLWSKFADSLAAIFEKKILDNPKVNPVSFSIGSQFLIGWFIFAIGIFLPNFGLLPGASFPWINILLMTVFYGLGVVLYIKSLAQIELSKMAIIMSLTSVFTIITSAIFLGESLSIIQIIGALIVLVGVLIVSMKKMKLTFGKGEWLALISAIVLGIQTTNDKYIMNSLGVYFYLFLGYTLPTLLIGLFYRKEVRMSLSTIKMSGYAKYFMYCFFAFSQAILFFIALNQTSSSLLVIFNLAGRILTVLMCVVFLRERDHLLQKFIGSAIVIGGLYILN